MKTTLIIIIIITLLAGCNHRDTDADVAVKTTGGICQPLLSHGTVTGEIACVNAGKRYLCVVAGERAECVLTNFSTPEKP